MADEIKPDCLLKRSIFWPFAKKLITLIVFAIGLVLVSRYGIIPRSTKYHPNIVTIFGYFDKRNIEEPKISPALRVLSSNINISFESLFQK